MLSIDWERVDADIVYVAVALSRVMSFVELVMSHCKFVGREVAKLLVLSILLSV